MVSWAIISSSLVGTTMTMTGAPSWVCQEAARGRRGFLIRKNYPFRQKILLALIALPLGDSNQKLNVKTPLLY